MLHTYMQVVCCSVLIGWQDIEYIYASGVLQYVAVCCSVLQWIGLVARYLTHACEWCVAVCCSVLQVCCSVLQCVDVVARHCIYVCNVLFVLDSTLLQRGLVCCSSSRTDSVSCCGKTLHICMQHTASHRNTLQHASRATSSEWCAAVRCSALQCLDRVARSCTYVC